MKKMIAMLLALVMALSLFAACGAKNDAPAEDAPSADAPVEVPGSALEILENVWALYGDDEKFPVMGGDANNMVDGAPGEFGLDDGEMATYQLLVPADQLANIDQAASLFHGMMLNNFTCGVFHVTGDVDAFVEAMYGAIKNNQWMCGFPESMIVAVIDGEYVLAGFGINDIMKPFVENVKEAHQNLDIVYLEEIA